MSLRVWLPLTKDLRNQGLNHVQSINIQTGCEIDDNGKLGKCYTNSGTTVNVANAVPFSASKFSACAWVKLNTRRNNWCRAFGMSGNGTYFGLGCEHTNGTSLGFHYYKTIDGTNTAIFDSYPVSVGTGTWNHFVMCYDGTKYYIYQNGNLVASADARKANIDCNMTTLYLFGGTANNYSQCSLNDVRIYDHCLSSMEVKELSKGLVVHYPLNRGGWGQENLVWDTHWDEVSTKWTNWGSPPTREIVSVNGKKYLHVKASDRWQGYSQNQTKRSGTGEITPGEQLTLSYYAYGAASYNSYPCIGIHWTDGSSIISQVWPRFNITTSPQKCTAVVTVPSGVSAFNIMVGNGSGTSGNTNEVWVAEVKLEKGSTLTPWSPAPTDTLATTMGLNSTTEYDCSGFCNNGTYSALPTVSSNTPKYNVSTYFGAYNTPHVDMLDNNLLSSLTKGSVAWWEYCTTTGNTLLFTGQDGSHYIGAGSTTIRLYDSHIGDSGIILYKDGVVQSTTQGTTVYHPNVFHTQNQWHHFVMTGVNLSEWTMFKINSYGSGWPLNAYISDVRIYATALSADDVKSLYQNSAYIDSSGNVYGAIHMEA